MKNILFLSNGYGEDVIASCLIKELIQNAGGNCLQIKAFPLVGKGKAYQNLEKNNLEILSPRRNLPSGGFIRRPGAILADLFAGLPFLILAQLVRLWQLHKKVSLTICVGDVYVLLFGIFSGGRPLIFLPTAKSDYMERHFYIEKWLMRRFCLLVFPRDEATAQTLRRAGINAFYCGNVMMDCIEITGQAFGLDQNACVLGLLPGSRAEAYMNLKDMLEVIEQTERNNLDAQEKVKFSHLLALAPTLSLEKIKEAARDVNWEFQPGQKEDGERGILGALCSGKFPFVKVLISLKFGDVINRADIVIGLAGTGHEQAAGLGKPVVAFPGRGPQMTAWFLRKKRDLLGGALRLVKKERAAQEIYYILTHPRVKEEMSKIGRQRMGGRGAAERIVKIMRAKT